MKRSMDHCQQAVLPNYHNLLTYYLILGGVPVFNLPIVKLCFFNCSLKPVEGFSLNLPAGVFSSPICIRPFKNVPVVSISLLQEIFFPDSVINPFMDVFVKYKLNYGVRKNA